jgi:hypothetical protein
MDLSSMIKKEKIRYSHRSSFKSKSPKAIIKKWKIVTLDKETKNDETDYDSDQDQINIS